MYFGEEIHTIENLTKQFQFDFLSENVEFCL